MPGYLGRYKVPNSLVPFGFCELRLLHFPMILYTRGHDRLKASFPSAADGREAPVSREKASRGFGLGFRV